MTGLRRASNSVFPVSRFAAAMHDCDHENVIWLDRVEYAIREDPRKTASNALVDDASTSRSVQDPSLSNFIPTPLRFSGPEPVDIAQLRRVEAFH